MKLFKYDNEPSGVDGDHDELIGMQQNDALADEKGRRKQQERQQRRATGEGFYGFIFVDDVRDRLAELESRLAADINAAYSDGYVEAAAALDYFDSAEFARLTIRLKGKGVAIGRWEHVVRDYARKERERIAATQAAMGDGDGASKAAAKIVLPEIQPCDVAVDTLTILNEVKKFVGRFLALSEDQRVAFTLWILFTHIFEIADVSPRLALLSATKRCGKSTALYLLALLCPRALASSNISPAAIFRVIDQSKPTLIIDEVDSLVPRKGQSSERAEELRGILNSGHRPDQAFVIRNVAVGKEWLPQRFSTWAAMSTAGIGSLPETWADRSVSLVMKRRTARETVERITRRNRPDIEKEAAGLASKLTRWGQDNADALRVAKPVLPAGLDDRAIDNWDLLLAIAELGGDTWGSAARRAAVTLSGEPKDDGAEGLGVKLLADCRTIFLANPAADEFRSSDLCEKLVAIEASPWATISRGKPITGHRLALMLKPFGIYKAEDRYGSKYVVSEFEDAFLRYPPIFADQTAIVPQAQRPVGDVALFEVPRGGTSKSADSPTESEACGTMALENADIGHDPEKKDTDDDNRDGPF